MNGHSKREVLEIFNKTNPAFTQGLERKTWYELVIYTIQTITILSSEKSKTLELWIECMSSCFNNIHKWFTIIVVSDFRNPILK